MKRRHLACALGFTLGAAVTLCAIGMTYRYWWT